MIDIFKIRNEMIEDITVEHAYGTSQDYIVKLADERFIQFLYNEYENFDEQDWEDVLTYAFESSDNGTLFEFIVDKSDGIITPEMIFNNAIQYENFSPLPYLYYLPFMDSKSMKEKLYNALVHYEDTIFNQIDKIRKDNKDYRSRERKNIFLWMDDYKMISEYLEKLQLYYH